MIIDVKELYEKLEEKMNLCDVLVELDNLLDNLLIIYNSSFEAQNLDLEQEMLLSYLLLQLQIQYEFY